MSGHPPDYFSAQADVYARYRPHYPISLFAFLASLVPARRLAWDCATGSGQAAIPFEEIDAPEFMLEVSWTLAELLGYVRSWSATTRYVKSRGDDPVPLLAQSLREQWGDPERVRAVRWPFVMRVGRVEPAG